MEQGTMTVGLSQGKLTLKTAAAHINRLHAEATNCCKAGLIKAKEAGEALLQAKEAIKHGAFEAWVNEECDFSVRSARRYMDIHRNWDQLIEEHGPGQMSILTLEDGIAKLTHSRKERKATTKPAPAPEPTEPCFKGGNHQWEPDPELSGDYCAKCHEQRPTSGQADDQDLEGDQEPEGPGAAEAVTPGVAARGVGGNCLDRLVKILKEAVDLVDQANQETPNSLHAEIIDSLNIAYQDAVQWRKRNHS